MTEREYNVPLTETELTIVISALEYLERRQHFLASLAATHGRDRECKARREGAAAASALSDRLCQIGVDPR